MMLLKAWRGRLWTSLLFLSVLAAIVSMAAGVARGTTDTTLEPETGAEQASFTVDARDLGEYDDTAPSIDSPSAIVVHMDTGKVLYEWDAYEQRRMASTTKIMTAILVLESMDLDAVLTASENAAATIEPKVWLRAGDHLTVEEFLYALMLRSANSAAVVLAEGCAGSVQSFVKMMNDKAAELGMKDTHFANPNGLDADGHYSTCADMATLARYAMENEMFRTIVSTEEYTVQLPGRTSILTFENTNKLLGAVGWVTGIKTGLTPKAEQCLVASASRDDVSVISVVLGQPASQRCFDESRILLDYGFSQYQHVKLVEAGLAVAEAEVPYRLDAQLQLVTESAAELDLYKDDVVTVTVVVDRPLVLPVKAGETYGQVELTVDDQVVDTIDLVASASYDKVTLGSKVAYYFKRLGRWLGGLG